MDGSAPKRLAHSVVRSACVLRTRVGLRAPHDGRPPACVRSGVACSARRWAPVCARQRRFCDTSRVSTTMTVWLDEPRERVANRIRLAGAAPGGLILRRLDDDGGELIGGITGATWGRIIHSTLVPDRGGTNVNAQWKSRYLRQIITWGQENRDLALFRRMASGHG